MWSLSGDMIPHCSSICLPRCPCLHHWEASPRPLVSSCRCLHHHAASLIHQAPSGKRHLWNIFWPAGDLDLWPTILTYECGLDILPLDLHTKNQVRIFVCSAVRVETYRHTDRQTDTQMMSKLVHPSLTRVVMILLTKTCISWISQLCPHRGSNPVPLACMATLHHASRPRSLRPGDLDLWPWPSNLT